MDIKNLSFEMIRDKFLSGGYEFNSTEYVDASEELHNKLVDINDIVPMLQSENKACQRSATYIAALEGKRACSIFPHVFELLDSQWFEVRDEVCDCFIDCATSAEQFIALFKLIDDPEQSIRIRIINVISGLSDEQIDLLFENVNLRSGQSEFSIGVGLLYEQKQAVLPFELLEKRMVDGTKATKFFTYAVCIRASSEYDINKLVKLSKSSEIFRHYEIYFE